MATDECVVHEHCLFVSILKKYDFGGALFCLHHVFFSRGNLFLAIMPISAAFFNYLLPLQIGARDAESLR